MKKVSAKRIFAIIGIVLGSVTAFVGAVFGVMAAMGKFKTPVVYPTQLVFLNNDHIVIERQTYDPEIDWEEQFNKEDNNPDPSIESIMLEGLNPGSEHAVNRKNCYLWFYENIGVDLITLCDKEGKPLVKDENNRYLVNCNEPIYYMINTVEEDAVTDGKVMLMARSENNKAQVDTPLTFWIDRVVDRVLVDIKSDTPTTTTQKITTGIGVGFDFKYAHGIGDDKIEAEDYLALKPIAKESAKEIELYYVATGYSTDYIKVTEDEVNNINSPLNSILTYNEGVFGFNALVAGEYTFKIGVFPTYQAKLDYLAEIEGVTINDPNYHRTTRMALTTLTIIVENVDVNEAGFNGTNVVLNLYSEKDYITLNGTSGVDGAKDNNLELYMKKGTENDYSRFDEVSMTGFDQAWADGEKHPQFETTKADGVQSFIYNGSMSFTRENTTVNLIPELTNVFLDAEKKLNIISYLYESTDLAHDYKYYCTNGVAVLDKTNGETIRVLKAGSYLNFYALENNEYTLKSFDYEINPIGQGQNKSWQIITKEIPKENLVLGILVVNNHGEYKHEDFFSTIDVTIEEVPFEYSIKQSSADLNISFEEGNKISCDKKSFEDFVTINAGSSYNASVLVTKASSIVKTIPSIMFQIDNEPYVLVGDFIEDEETGYKTFVNIVQVLDSVTKDNQTTNLYLLQLLNDYNESTEAIINAWLNSEGQINTTEKVGNLYKDDNITINSKYILNEDLLEYTFRSKVGEEYKDTATNGENYSVYENTSNHEIVITAKNIYMIDKIVEFYGVDATFFTTSQELNLQIVDAQKETGALENESAKLIVLYKADRYLSDESTVISITWDKVGTALTLPNGVMILSGSPNNIVLNGEDNSIILYDEKTLAEYGETYIKVEVSYNGSEYEYKFILINEEENKEFAEEIDVTKNSELFNTNISNPKTFGFQGAEDKGQNLKVTYNATNKEIFNTDKLSTMKNLVEQGGETVISVEIGETTKYLKLVADTSKFELLTTDNKTSFDTPKIENIKLDEFVSVTYSGGNAPTLTKENLVNIENVVCVSYGNGALVINGNKDAGYTLEREIITKVEGTSQISYETVLTISNTNGWTFSKPDQYISLTIKFDVVTVAGTKNIELTFSSDIAVSVGEDWKNNRVFYAGTKVQLLSKTVEKGETQTPSVFHADNTNITFTINDKADAISTVNGINNVFTVPEDYIGQTIKISLYIGTNNIRNFTDFEVKANVIASVVQKEIEIETEEGKKKVKIDQTFTSETDYEVSGIFSLSSYKTDTIYGSSSDNLYITGNLIPGDTTDLTISPVAKGNSDPILLWGYKVYYGEDLTDKYVLDITNEYISTSDTTRQDGVVYYEKAENKLTIGQMTQADTAITRQINLKYKSYTVGTYDIQIENKHKVDLIKSGEESSLTFKALKGYSPFATCTGFELTAIEADNLEFKVDYITNEDNSVSTIFTITTEVLEELEGVYVTLTFKKGTQILIYHTSINIVPFTPEEDGTKATAFSGSSYDLYGARYNSITSNIKSLYVNGIKNEKGEDITNVIINGENGEFVPSGYTQGSGNPNCNIVFNEIDSDELLVYVEFIITYSNDKSYTYLRPLTIKNRQVIDITYPEQDLTFASANYKFKIGETDNSKDGARITGEKIDADAMYTITNVKYEAVAIHTNEAVDLQFNEQDTIKKTTRVQVKDIHREVGSSKNLDVQISVVGYQNNPGMDIYASQIKTATNSIVLPQASQGIGGMLVFKIQSESTNTRYYFVYVYCVGSSSNINAENNLKVVASSGVEPKLNVSKETNIVEYAVGSNQTYANVVSELYKSTSLYKDENNNIITFKNLFGVDYDSKTTRLYLYDAEVTGGAAYNYNRYFKFESITEQIFKQAKADKNIYIYDSTNGYVEVEESSVFDENISYYYKKSIQYTNVTDQVVDFDNNFNTITLGLMHYSGIELYVYGTITIYLQPEEQITVGSELEYAVPNGEFGARITPSKTETDCPFGSDWEATIISIDGTSYLEKQLYGIEIVSGNKLSTPSRVPTDVLIRVQYKHTTNNTIVFVNYIFEATTLPEDNQSVTIGTFTTANGFQDSIDLLDSTTTENRPVSNKEFFFGTYSGDYEISYTDGGTEHTLSGSTTNVSDSLQFDLETAQRPVDVTIKYVGMAEEEKSRIFKFIIKAGIYFAEADSSESGISSSRRAPTTSTDKFDDATGSNLGVVYNGNTSNYYSYSVAGLTVYTYEASKLDFTFDKESYINKAKVDENEPLVVTANSTNASIPFTHTPVDVDINATITISTTGTGTAETYATKSLYIKAVKTYSKLEAVYCDEGAQHENVAAYLTNAGGEKEATTIVLQSNLLTTSKIKLYDADNDVKTTVKLDAMGFTTKGNPNYVEFTVGGNATIQNNETITFNMVTKNTLCEVYLNNKAGMPEVVYTYQIMAGDKADGLDLTTATGYTGSNYISFSMNDNLENKYAYQSKTFVIGTMKDLQNSSIFTVSINDTSYVLQKASVESDAKIISVDGDNSNEIGGYFNAIQYKFKNGDYEFYITLDADTSQVELIVIRPAGKNKQAEFNLPISIGGVNGAGTIIDGFNIVLSNYQVKQNVEGIDTSIYAGYIVDLTEKFTTTNLADGASTAVNYELAGGTYVVDGETRTILATETTNDLFKFNSSTSKFETRAVGSDVLAKIKFNVKVGGYVIEQIEFIFYVRLNMQFIVNGAELDNTTPETNFELTTVKDKDGDKTTFPIRIDFISGLSTTDFVTTGTNADVQGNYYRVLAFDLYRLKMQGNENATKADLVMGRENTFIVELQSNIASDILVVDNTGITFNKDYTGDIELKLSLTTSNGTYYTIWTIHVHGIKDIEYASKDTHSAKLLKDSLPFSSGDSVDLIASSTGKGVGITMQDPKYFVSTGVNMNMHYDYVINANNSETSAMTNYSLFTNTNKFFISKTEGGEKLNTPENKLSLILPNVPVTSEQANQAYIVTYKVYVEYLGLTYDSTIADSQQKVEIFYASYIVRNLRAIEAVNKQINVDELKDGSGTVDYVLDLFYFTETYTVGVNIYKFTYDGSDVYLTIDGVADPYKLTSFDGSEHTFTNTSSTDKYLYDIAANKLYLNTTDSTPIATESNRTTETQNNTVFSANFSSVIAYKEFVDAYKSVTATDYVELTDGTKSFKYALVYNDDTGAFAITLNDWKDKGSEKLFKNEGLFDLRLVEKGAPIVSVAKYATDNTEGFKLITNNVITAKTNGGAGVKLSTMFLPSYFEATAAGKAESTTVTLSTTIIGVGSPAKNWVNPELEPNTTTYTDNYATITIPNGGSGNIYNVKKVAYSNGGNPLYDIIAEFYYLDGKSSSITQLVVPYYYGVGYEDSFFKVAYIPNQDNQIVNLTKGFLLWGMSGGELKNSNEVSTLPAIEFTSNPMFEINGDDTLTLPTYDGDNKLIYISSNDLNAYKAKDPTKKSYPTITATITVNGLTYLCDIGFALPEYVRVETEIDTSVIADQTVELINQIWIPNVSGGYTQLTSENISEIDFIDEISSGGYLKSYASGVLTFDYGKVKAYLENETYLTITLQLTTEDEITLTFQVVIEKIA